MPKMFDLRADPYEHADVTSNTYYDWYLDHMFFVIPATAYVQQFIATFKEFPPRQEPPKAGIQERLDRLLKAASHD
jgi:hypothetical protein